MIILQKSGYFPMFLIQAASIVKINIQGVAFLYEIESEKSNMKS